MNVAQAEIELAWKRVKLDKDRVFVRHPYELALIDIELNPWLEDVRLKLNQGIYQPQAPSVCDAPKSPITVRPGALLTITDRLVFATCVGACLPAIAAALATGSDELFDYSYQLSADGRKPQWLVNRFQCWRAFREDSLNAVSSEITYVVFADIAGFYENVDLSMLISDLRAASAPVEAVNQLSLCLNKWAYIHGRTLPQGHSPADILAKLYLHSVDVRLRDLGYQHKRFVDDFRIFCRTRDEAVRGLMELTRLLRERGLVLNSAKSQIIVSGSAKRKVDGTIPIIEGVKKSVIERIKQQLGPAYAFQAAGALRTSGDDIPQTLIEETFQAYFIDRPNGVFLPTLFHFLLRRLAEKHSEIAIDYCLSNLARRPEETETILSYLKNATTLDAIDSQLINVLTKVIFAYQVYKIVEWPGDLNQRPSESLLANIRRHAFDATTQPYVRSACIRMLEQYGSTADLQRLESRYGEARNDLERCEIVCALRRMETGRRNEFLGRVKNDSELNKRAVKWVRSSPID